MEEMLTIQKGHFGAVLLLEEPVEGDQDHLH
jgi:hypothetical protein